MRSLNQPYKPHNMWTRGASSTDIPRSVIIHDDGAIKMFKHPPDIAMFSRPYRHVPLFPKTPAGFRTLKPCLRPFIFSRKPNPPLCTSPIHPPFDENAPPTQGLPQIFEFKTTKTDNTNCTPKNVTPLPRPNVYRKTPSLIPHRRKHGHKKYAHSSANRRRSRFRTTAQIKRQKAAVVLDKLEDVACDTMQTGRMTREDHIFLKQLEELRLDQHHKHKLGDAREIVERAEALTPRRVLAHAKRDRHAAARVVFNARRRKEDEELRHQQELRRKEEEHRRLEEEKRKEEEAMRRAAEWARLREQRERELQAKKEAFRKARKEAERHAREQAARHIREEAQRQERLRQEELNRKAAEAGVVACLQLYDAKWEELKKSKTLTSVMLCEMPWPIFAQGCTSPDEISQRSIEEFIFHPLRIGMEAKSRKDRLRIEMLRFHPDKFDSYIVGKLREGDRERAIEIAGAVARILTSMMAEEIQRERTR